MVATLFSHRATQNEISVRLAFFIVFFFLKNLAEMQKLSGNVCSHFVKKKENACDGLSDLKRTNFGKQGENALKPRKSLAFCAKNVHFFLQM